MGLKIELLKIAQMVSTPISKSGVTIQQRFIKMAKSLRISHPKKNKCHFTKGLFCH
jgi:dimeric dUTPase (all-alpha-NTP-PPase superfamily)